jgi:UV excision repair protein RAD23
MGSQGEAVIAQMEAMGFPRADIDRAMRAAFFNPDRAVDYLLNVSFAGNKHSVTTAVKGG